VVRCGFCGAEFAVIQSGDQVHFQVMDQPQPQKDELSQAGQAAAMQAGKEAADDLAAALSDSGPEIESSPGPMNISAEPTMILSRPDQTPDFFEQSGAPAEPTIIRPSASIPEDLPPQSSPAADLPTEPETPAGHSVVYEQPEPAPVVPPAPPPSGQRNKWLPIGIAAVVVLCLACVCVVGAIVLFVMPMVQQYSY
jgi:hypothetical protein